jgi:hypothetical protein
MSNLKAQELEIYHSKMEVAQSILRTNSKVRRKTEMETIN